MMNFKTMCCGILLSAMSICMPMYAKTAKDIAESNFKAFSNLAEQSNVAYTCNGDDRNATCTAKHIPIEKMSLDNVVLKVNSSNNTYKAQVYFDIGYLEDLGIYDEVKPNKINCDVFYTANGVILNSNITCSVLSSSYSFKIKNIADVVSKNFNNKDIDSILDEFENIQHAMLATEDSMKILNRYKINLKELSFELKGNKLGDKIFKIIKHNDGEYTREQYIASVNMGVAMVPVSLANEKSMSQPTINQLSKLAVAIGELLTSKKQYVSAKFTKKTNSMLNLYDLMQMFDEPLTFTKYIDEYNINITSR